MRNPDFLSITKHVRKKWSNAYTTLIKNIKMLGSKNLNSALHPGSVHTEKQEERRRKGKEGKRKKEGREKETEMSFSGMQGIQGSENKFFIFLKSCSELAFC